MSSSKADLTAYVLDPDPAWRDELALFLGREGVRFQLFAGLDELLPATGPDCAGCLLMEWDCTRHGNNPAIEVKKRLHSRGAVLPVVFFHPQPDAASVRQAFRGGALDFLGKPAAPEELRATLAEAFGAERRRLAAHRQMLRRESLYGQLTPRERQVADLVAEGRDNADIAGQLQISHRTVEVHKTRLMKKLGACSLADLIRLANIAGHKGNAVRSRTNTAMT